VNGITGPAFEKSGITWLVFDFLFKVPITSDVFNWLRLGSAGKSNFMKLLKKSKNIALLPGGFEEATMFSRSKHRIFIKNRKGFIKLALKFGYKV